MISLPSSLPVIVMGLTSMLLQITVLRLLLSTFSGNEIDIGITLSFWLIYVGIGSYTGKRISFKHAFGISFSLIAILSLPTVMAIKAIRTFLALEPGETVSFIDTVSSTALTLFPLCFIIGAQFPLAVSYAGNRNAAGRIYGLEALGAFGGGILFTFMIASRIYALELCLILSLLNLMTAVYLSRKKIVLVLCLIPLFFYFIFHTSAPSFLWHGAEVTQVGESKLGEIAVIKVGGQSSIYANGQLVFSYPDAQVEEMTTHLPMTMHPSPKNILVIGGSPGALKELLKYRVDRIDFLELDPRILDFSLTLLNTPEYYNVIKDSRIHLLIQDGRRFIKSVKTPIYDLIILNLPQPSTASINRFYTIEFFREARSVLREDGILAMHIPQSAGYMGKRMQMASGSVYNSLRTVFQSVAVTSQEYGMLFSSDTHIDSNPDVLEERFAERHIAVEYFHQYIFRDAFSSFGVDYVKQRLSEAKSINTDFHPSAYLFNLMLWAEMHGGKALHYLLHIKGWHIFTAIIIILSLLSVFLFRQTKRVISFSVFTTGFSGMSFVLTVILAYQSLHGYVYEMIGMLSALFMIGLWAGTSATNTLQKPVKTLLILEICTISLAVLSVFLLKIGSILYFVVFSAGTVSGAQFSTANLSLGESTDGGRLYALDLIGSFIGALISSLIIIPLAGIPSALFFVALIKAFSAMLILSLRPFYENLT
jgi:spermidine synthase